MTATTATTQKQKRAAAVFLFNTWTVQLSECEKEQVEENGGKVLFNTWNSYSNYYRCTD